MNTLLPDSDSFSRRLLALQGGVTRNSIMGAQSPILSIPGATAVAGQELP